MKILVVEDDPKISSFVKIGLESNDFTVDEAFDSTMGEKLATSKKYDVIILDVVIPGVSGFVLCRNIRSKGVMVPVIMLTSLDGLEDKLEGFNCGADDYLTKPFSFQELLARVRALTRRNRDEMVRPVMRVGDLEVDSVARKVRRAGKEINLTATEYRILELLMINKDKVYDRVFIAEKIWGFTFNSGTNIIDVHINSLRKKIDRDFETKLIHTRKGFGYVLSEEG
jgi:two-component system, OmpR family, copper resistance phosphate regulon response regulator CusR